MQRLRDRVEEPGAASRTSRAACAPPDSPPASSSGPRCADTRATRGYGGKEQYLCLGDWKADPRALDTVRTRHCSSAGGNSGGPIVAASADPETGSAVPTVIGVLSTTRSGAPFHADTWGVIAQQADAFAEQPPAHRARAAYTPGENTGHWLGGTYARREPGGRRSRPVTRQLHAERPGVLTGRR